MTKRQRLLALEAAVCACEGYHNSPALKALADELDLELSLEAAALTRKHNFSQFIKDQAEAVQLLAQSPAAWGGE